MKAPRLASASLAVATAATLSACAQYEPANDRVVEDVAVVEFLVRGPDTEQIVMAELYAQTMTRQGKEATLKLLRNGEEPLSLLARGYGDVFIACSGKRVEEINPRRAAELHAKYAELEGELTPANQDEKREDSYSALMASLESGLDATDPSNAVACSDWLEGRDETTALSNNLVPVYRVPTLDRELRQSLNYMSGTLTTEDLKELVDEVDANGNLNEVVSAYLDSKDI